MGQAHATKTLRQPLEHRPGVSEWFATTEALCNALAAFSFHVLSSHPAVIELPAKDALPARERLTPTTASHPSPVMPLTPLAVQVPADFRRAAIHAALGTMRSFPTHLARWHRARAQAEAHGKPCRVRPPVPPRTWNRSVVCYDGMCKQDTSGRISRKRYDGQTWRWVRLRVFGRATPDGWKPASPQAVQHGKRW